MDGVVFQDWCGETPGSASGRNQRTCEYPGVFEMPTGVPILEIIYNGRAEFRAIKESRRYSGRFIYDDSARRSAWRCSDGCRVFEIRRFFCRDGWHDCLGFWIPILFQVITRIAEFYYRESCGQCTPCRERYRLDVLKFWNVLRKTKLN